MAIIQISKIQQRSGNIVDLPQLDEAEFGWATDVKRLYIGKTSPNENIEVLTSYSNISFSQINGSYGNLDIDSANLSNGQPLVYTGSEWTNRGGNVGGLINLGDVSNVKIDGGALTYVLETDGTGNLSWAPKTTIVAFMQNATKANPGVVTTTEDNYFINGSYVTITNVPGMTQLNGNSYYANVITSNSFSLYSDAALTVPVDTSAYSTFPYTSVTNTDSTNNRITVGASAAFTINDPVIFIGTTFGGIDANTTYYVLTKPTGTTITISETVGGTVFPVLTDSGSCNVYVPGGRIVSLVSGAGGGGIGVAGGTDTMVQFNNTNILDGSSDLTFSYTASPKLLTLNGNANVGNLNSTSLVTASRFVSNVAIGTEPISVTSTTRVANLNVSYSNVSDFGAVTLQTTGSYFPVFASSSATGNRALAANANLGFNVATGNLSATILSANGNITGANLISISTVGADFNIVGPTQTTTNTAGGNINITAGIGNGTGAGGGIYLLGGSANASVNASGGPVSLTGGTGNGTGVGGQAGIFGGVTSNTNAGVAANVIVTSGAINGIGGNIVISGGTAYGTNKVGGVVQIAAGASTGSAAAGTIILQTSTVGTTGTTTQTLANRVVIDGTTVNVTTSTNSTSTSTGGLVVVGGTGIGGNLYVGGTINGNVTGNISGDVSGNLLYGRFLQSPYPEVTPQRIINPGTGGLTQITTAISSGAQVYGVAVDPTGKFVYVTNGGSNTVSQFSINQSTGALTSITTAIASGNTPVGIAADPTGRFVYVTNNAASTVSQYSINQTTGALSVITTAIASGSSPVGIAVDPTGRFVYVTNNSSNTISQYSINQTTGALTSITTAIASGNTPVGIAADPTGRFVYVTNYYSNTISQYSINQTTGALTNIGTITSGNSTSIIVDSTGRFVYVVNINANTVSQFSINQSTGALSVITTAIASGSGPQSITIEPTGKFVYVSNYNSTSISQYSINQWNGSLTLVSTTTGITAPQSIASDPTGRFLYVGIFTSGAVGQYSIGSLSAGSTTIAGNITVSGIIAGNITSLTTGASSTAGSVTGNWTLTSGSRWNATYADLAEYYSADRDYSPGTVLEFGGVNEVTLATNNTTSVAGVVSTDPAFAMNAKCLGDHPLPIALQGRVPTKVVGTIRKGDMMVSAGNGYATACTSPTLGTVIGKSLENFDGEGIIEIAIGRL